MFSNRLTFAALAVACIAAAGAGGYFASRQNTVPAPAAAADGASLAPTPRRSTLRFRKPKRSSASPSPPASSTTPRSFAGNEAVPSRDDAEPSPRAARRPAATLPRRLARAVTRGRTRVAGEHQRRSPNDGSPASRFSSARRLRRQTSASRPDDRAVVRIAARTRAARRRYTRSSSYRRTR